MLFGILPDAPQLFASIALRTANIWEKWGSVPEWIHKAHKLLHSSILATMAWGIAAFTGDDVLYGCAFAMFLHAYIDQFTHDYTDPAYPFRDVTVSLGQTFHAWDRMMKMNGTWPIVLAMVLASVGLAIWRGAWHSLFH